MKKYILLAAGFFLLTSASAGFAAGKVLPFNWDKPNFDPGEMQACPTEDLVENTMGMAIVTPKSNAKGRITIIRAKTGEKEFLSPFMSVELENGDEILSSDSGATITFSDGSVATMGHATNVKYYANEKITKLDLLVGKLRILRPANLIKHLRGLVAPKLETRNRVSAACVRGTEYIMEQSEDGNIGKYYLNEGALDIVTLAGEKLKINAGDIVIITGTGQIVSEKLDGGVWGGLIEQLSPDEASKSGTNEKKGTVDYSFVRWIGPFILFGFFVFLFYRKRA